MCTRSRNTCSRDSATNTVRSLTSQGAISPALSTRGQSRPLALEQCSHECASTSQTHLTQVLHGSEQATKEENTCRFAFTTDSSSSKGETLNERIPRCTQKNQNVRSIVPYLASTDGQNPIITDSVFTASCPTLHPLIDITQSSTTRMINTVPRLAFIDHRTQ